MKLEVEVISEDLVRPSSPTPEHLRQYRLSFLDQVTVDVYNPMIYFYEPNNGDEDQSSFKVDEIKTKLKTSLSDVLSHYYPLAGRVNYDNSTIDCNDDGVPFYETRVKGATLHDVVHKSYPADLNDLVPFELDQLNEISMGIQLNVFECGGIGVGICISHKIADALSFFSVVNGWAAVTRGEKNYLGRRHLVAAKLFPPRNVALHNTRNSIVRERVAKRFVLKSSKVEAIRAKYAENCSMENQRRPSRIEALSAFIYSRFLAAIKDDGDSESSAQPDRLYLVCHTVNIRSKLDPALPEEAFGNYYRTAMTTPSTETLNDPRCNGLVKEVRDEINKISPEFLKQFQEENSQLDNMKETAARFAKGEIVSCAFTSLCRFPLYQADFGWGKPVWAASPALIFKNLVVFMDSAKSADPANDDDDGIDVLIHLKPEHMAKLEVDDEFVNYVLGTGSA